MTTSKEQGEWRRPLNGPVCKHGKPIGGRGCVECQRARDEIMKKLQPLVDLFWDNRGEDAGDLKYLMFQAYRMGEESKE